MVGPAAKTAVAGASRFTNSASVHSVERTPLRRPSRRAGQCPIRRERRTCTDRPRGLWPSIYPLPESRQPSGCLDRPTPHCTADISEGGATIEPTLDDGNFTPRQAYPRPRRANVARVLRYSSVDADEFNQVWSGTSCQE